MIELKNIHTCNKKTPNNLKLEKILKPNKSKTYTKKIISYFKIQT